MSEWSIKIGDKVRIVEDILGGDDCYLIGTTGTVVKVCPPTRGTALSGEDLVAHVALDTPPFDEIPFAFEEIEVING